LPADVFKLHFDPQVIGRVIWVRKLVEWNLLEPVGLKDVEPKLGHVGAERH